MAWNEATQEFDTVETSQEDEELGAKYEKRLKHNATFDEYDDVESEHFNKSIRELQSSHETKSLDNFVKYKLENDEFTFTTLELQALAHNIDWTQRRIPHALPPTSLVKKTKDELVAFGFEFVPRQPIKHVRGAHSSAHGTHPFAGAGGGGTGMGTSKDGPSGFGFGGGPGVMGGGYAWNKNDTKNLKMCK